MTLLALLAASGASAAAFRDSIPGAPPDSMVSDPGAGMPDTLPALRPVTRTLARRDRTFPGTREEPIPPEVRAWQTGLFRIRNDRLQHFTFSVTLGVGIGLAAREPWAGGLGSLSLGFAKEIADRRAGRRFDLVDLAADALGAAVGALIVEEVIR